MPNAKCQMPDENTRPPRSHAHSFHSALGIGHWAFLGIGVVLIIVGLLSPGILRAADVPAKPDATGDKDADTVVVDDRTELVINGAIKYLAGKQAADGGFGDNQRVAFTAYALMSFLSTGQIPGEGQYGANVSKAVQFLLSNQRADGYIAATAGQSSMYGHGIATIALSEAYGQSKDENVRPKLEKAVQLIISCQNQAGGWRYTPKPADADISVTVLQVVALRAAKNSGLDVPQSTIDNAIRFVKSCADPSGGFTYQPHNNAPGFARTAAAVYSLQVCGLYDDPLVKKGSHYLFNARGDQQWFTYGNFYAAPAQYMVGGDTWKRWYTGIHDILMNKVSTEVGGIRFWHPIDGGSGQNDIYATSVYTMILAMPYHYIPLYQR